MGYIIEIRCSGCGLHQRQKFGFGMSMGPPHVPAVTPDGELVSQILVDGEDAAYQYFHQASDPDQDIVSSLHFGDHVLPVTGHDCPDCGETKLEIQAVGMWD